MPNLSVVYADDQIMVINKPAHMVVTPTETQSEPTLSEILQKEYSINIDRGGIVHRLDKDTSGLLVIAKDLQSLETLQFQFKERQVKKEYLALVHGIVEKEGNVAGAIHRNPGDREKFIVLEGGKEAETGYIPENYLVMPEEKIKEVFEGFNKIQFRKLEASKYGQFTLVRCFPKTGRTHQIRVHLKYINHPIVGDGKYGGRKTTRLDKRWCPRQFLHAARLEFYHPFDGKKMSFEADLPEDLRSALNILEKRES